MKGRTFIKNSLATAARFTAMNVLYSEQHIKAFFPDNEGFKSSFVGINIVVKIEMIS